MAGGPPAEGSPVHSRHAVDATDPAASFREWERAEIERSGLEATLKAHPPVATSPEVLARYADPPGDSAYPWEHAFHLLGDATGLTVLDLGCGDGECTTLVASHGARVAAVDISTDLLARARTRLRLDGHGTRVAPLCASAHALPVASASVDLVFGMAVLHHLDLDTTGREVHRVLKPGGRAIFCEPVRDSKLLAAIRDRIPYRAPDISPFERPLTFAEIEAFASRFQTFRSRAFALPLVQVARVARLPAVCQRLAYASSAALLGRLPALRRFASVVVFEVRK
jgi:SAM-dependent methyltransferase